MQLRRKVKAPKRYDDESFNDPDRKPDILLSPPPAPSRAKTRIHPSLQPKIIEFNPNLPPAAFPTLDTWLPRESAVDDSDGTLKSVSSASSPPPFDPCPSSIETKNEVINESILPAMTFDFQDMDGPNGRTDREPPMTHPPFSMMTSEEQFMFDMQTSDEEEPSGKAPERKRKMVEFNVQGEGTLGESSLSKSFNNCPGWEELSVAHQIDLVLSLSDLHGTIGSAMEKLRLDQQQSEIMLDLIDQHNEQESTENARLLAFQQRLNGILLDDAGRVKHVSQERFRQLATDHLYSHSTGQDFHFSTAAEFGKAARYLESCGHAPDDLLNHWHDEFGARAVSRLPSAARTSKRNFSRSEHVDHSKQAASAEQKSNVPNTPDSLPSPASPPADPAFDPAFNPTAASTNRKTVRNIRRRQVGVIQAARKRAYRSGNAK